MSTTYFGPTDIDPVATGANIRLKIKAEHYTISAIAASLCISEQAVYKMLRGNNLPTIGNLFNISRLLGTTVDELLIPYNYKEEDSQLSSSNFFRVVF